MLEGHPDIVAEGATGRAALDAVHQCAMAVHLTDLALPDRSGIDVLRTVRASHPKTAVLMLGAYPEDPQDRTKLNPDGCSWP